MLYSRSSFLNFSSSWIRFFVHWFLFFKASTSSWRSFTSSMVLVIFMFKLKFYSATFLVFAWSFSISFIILLQFKWIFVFVLFYDVIINFNWWILFYKAAFSCNSSLNCYYVINMYILDLWNLFRFCFEHLLEKNVLFFVHLWSNHFRILIICIFLVQASSSKFFVTFVIVLSAGWRKNVIFSLCS